MKTLLSAIVQANLATQEKAIAIQHIKDRIKIIEKQLDYLYQKNEFNKIQLLEKQLENRLEILKGY